MTHPITSENRIKIVELVANFFESTRDLMAVSDAIEEVIKRHLEKSAHRFSNRKEVREQILDKNAQAKTMCRFTDEALPPFYTRQTQQEIGSEIASRLHVGE